MIDALQARVGPARSPRCSPTTATRRQDRKVAAARADHGQARGRPASRRRAPTACSRSTCTPGRSRASSTSRSTTSSRPAGHRRLPGQEGPRRTRSSSRPTPAASSARAPSPSASTRGSPSSTSGATGPTSPVFMHLIGDVKGKDVVVIDDMIDTAGTLIQAVERRQARGRAPHPRLRRPRRALGPGHRAHRGSRARRGRRHQLDPAAARQALPKITCSRWRRCSAEAIRRIHDEESVSTLFV